MHQVMKYRGELKDELETLAMKASKGCRSSMRKLVDVAALYNELSETIEHWQKSSDSKHVPAGPVAMSSDIR